MRKILVMAATAALLLVVVSPVSAAQRTEASIKAEIDAYVVAHPMDFRGIDALQFKLRGTHIGVRAAGVAGELTADQAADLVSAAAGNVAPMSGVPTPQLYITKLTISGGVQFWGTWDFPDWWAGQGSPVDLAAITVSTDSCTQTRNDWVWTYRAPSTPPAGGQTYLGTRRQHYPDHWSIWNIADYTTNFLSQADRGTMRFEVVRTAACSGAKNVGAAFDYEANQGGGVLSVSLNFGFFSVNYSPPANLSGHWGTDAIWQQI